MIVFFSYSFILLLCTNTIIRNKENFGVEFEIVGLFYITLIYLLFGLYVSKRFRKILLSKISILLLSFLMIGTITGLFSGNELYFIKDDYFRIFITYTGILTPLLIYGNKVKVDSTLIVLTSTLYFSIIIYFFLSGVITIGEKNSIYSVIQILSLFMPILLFRITVNKIMSYSNKKYLLLIFMILSYESFIAFTRTNIFGIVISLMLLLIYSRKKYTLTLDSIKNIALFALFTAIIISLILVLKTSFIDRTYSDNYRLFEAAYIYQEYISDSIVFGNGLGSTFKTPLGNEVETEAHIGFMTILLKFGLIGIIVLLFIFGRIFFIFFKNSNLNNLNESNKIILIVPALSFWIMSLLVSKGTFPEQLFGLGLAIGSYFQFTMNNHNVNYKLNSIN